MKKLLPLLTALTVLLGCTNKDKVIKDMTASEPGTYSIYVFWGEEKNTPES